jgi:hypothetical protein
MAVTVAHAQEFDERSMPEPTDLAVEASNPGAQVREFAASRKVESGDSSAEIDAVEVIAPGGVRLPGVRVSLQHSGDSDQIYLDAAQARQFRDELAKLEGGTQGCEASEICVYGIARCRPSQTVRQAYCPGVYEKKSGERGIALSTPRGSLQFPGVEAQAFVAALEAAIATLAGSDARVDHD